MTEYKKKREEVLLGSGIEQFFTKLEEKEKKEQRKKSGRPFDTQKGLCEIWRKIASEHFQEHTDNVVYSTRSEKTEILVFTDDSSYAAELSMDKELYRLRMQGELGKEIADIKFLVSRKAAQRKAKE